MPRHRPSHAETIAPKSRKTFATLNKTKARAPTNCTLSKTDPRRLPGMFSLLTGSNIVHTSCDITKLVGENKRFERIEFDGQEYELTEFSDNRTIVLKDMFCGSGSDYKAAYGVNINDLDESKDWIALDGEFKLIRGSDIVFSKIDQKPAIDDGECIRFSCDQFTILSGTGDGKTGRSTISRTCATAGGD